MSSVLRALFRAVISLLHPRMLWLAIWPFLLAALFWGVVGWNFSGPVLAALHDAFFGLALIQWVEGSFRFFGLAWLLEVLVPLFYLVVLASLSVVTALFILGTLAMPIVIDHVAARHHPTLERRHGGNAWVSLANAAGGALIFLCGWLVTMPLWLFLPLAVLLPWFWWAWLMRRVFSYDALVQHASAEERVLLINQHGGELFVVGLAVAAMNFVPPLFFVAPIYGGLAFTHFCLEELERLRGVSEVPRLAARDAIGRMILERPA